MPNKGQRPPIPSPLDTVIRAIETGKTGGGAASEAEQMNSSPPEFLNTGAPERESARIPEFQNTSDSAPEQVIPAFVQNSKIPERPRSDVPERESARTPPFKRSKAPATPKLNADGWEQQTIYLPPDLRLWLRQYALMTNQEISEIAAIALHEYRIKQQRG